MLYHTALGLGPCPCSFSTWAMHHLTCLTRALHLHQVCTTAHTTATTCRPALAVLLPCAYIAAAVCRAALPLCAPTCLPHGAHPASWDRSACIACFTFFCTPCTFPSVSTTYPFYWGGCTLGLHLLPVKRGDGVPRGAVSICCVSRLLRQPV